IRVRLHRQTLHRGGEIRGDRPLAPVHEQLRYWNTNRTYLRASSAEAGGERKRHALLQAEDRRSENRPDRAGVRPAVGVAARLPIDGADVQACTAAHAPEGLPGVLVR